MYNSYNVVALTVLTFSASSLYMHHPVYAPYHKSYPINESILFLTWSLKLEPEYSTVLLCPPDNISTSFRNKSCLKNLYYSADQLDCTAKHEQSSKFFDCLCMCGPLKFKVLKMNVLNDTMRGPTKPTFIDQNFLQTVHIQKQYLIWRVYLATSLPWTSAYETLVQCPTAYPNESGYLGVKTTRIHDWTVKIALLLGIITNKMRGTQLSRHQTN